MGLRHRPKASAFYQHRQFIENIRGLKHSAIGIEHRHFGETEFYQLERHKAIVDFRKCWSEKLRHVDLDALRREIIEQTGKNCSWITCTIERTVNQIHADNTDGVLLV